MVYISIRFSVKIIRKNDKRPLSVALQTDLELGSCLYEFGHENKTLQNVIFGTYICILESEKP